MRLPTRPVREQKVAALEAATHLVPGYARLQAELAHAHLTILELRMDELTGSASARCGGWTRADCAPGWAWRDRSGAIDAVCTWCRRCGISCGRAMSVP